MNEPMVFTEKEAFLAKLRELKVDGRTWKDMRIHLPFEVPEVEEILEVSPGGMRFFAVSGGLAGFLGGLTFTIYTALSWPLITGGKPIVSIPPFLLIAYILTILVGALVSFGGFLLLARLPNLKDIAAPEEFGNLFVIILEDREEPCKS